jgi:4-hydroxybenzoate polyprenyltransferase
MRKDVALWRMREQLCHEAYTIWLFTRSDLKTIVLPKTVFGILAALPGSSLVTQSNGTVVESISRAPLVVFWVWIVLLPFVIDNQRRAESIEEDKLNKPWRPLPSKRLTAKQAWSMMVVGHCVGLAYSLFAGGWRQKLIGILLGWIYNDLGAADRSCIARNAVNALGYVTFGLGATAVAGPGTFTPAGLRWFVLQGCVVFTTIQIQDLADMEGDAARARRTVPLVLGTQLCRWTIASMVPFWTLVAVSYWGTISLQAILGNVIAMVVSWRVLHKTDRSEDKVTFRLWNLWLVLVYMLPLATTTR